jgi:hypothetical protein
MINIDRWDMKRGMVQTRQKHKRKRHLPSLFWHTFDDQYLTILGNQPLAFGKSERLETAEGLESSSGQPTLEPGLRELRSCPGSSLSPSGKKPVRLGAG